MSKTERFFLGVDWPLLSKQKVTLVEYISQRAEYLEDQADTDPALADLDGILNFLDAIQDFAADEFGFTTHFPVEEYPSIGKCVFCHKPLYDHMGPTLVDDTEGDICDANYPHCLGFKDKGDGSSFCADCEIHMGDHPDVT
jgi:hypothetical protein